MPGLPVETQMAVRGSGQPDLAANGVKTPSVNGRGDQIIAVGLPLSAELVRHGESYVVIQASAVAPVVALPTTTAQVSLWNGEPDNGRTLILDSVFITGVVSAAAATALGVAVMLNEGRVSQPSGTLLTPKGLSGQPGGGSRARPILAATVVDNGWHPLGNSVVGPASQIGLNLDVPVNGLYLVRPGCLISFAALANTASTITVKIGFRWHEVNLAAA